MPAVGSIDKRIKTPKFVYTRSLRLLCRRAVCVAIVIAVVVLVVTSEYGKLVLSRRVGAEGTPCSATNDIFSRQACVTPFVSFEKRFRVAPKYGLNFCAIEKNFSTMLTAIACFLYNEKAYRASNRTFKDEDFHHRFCGSKNEAHGVPHVLKKFGNKVEWAHIAVVRDPIERFISGFTDKCLIERRWKHHVHECNGCKTNVTCFVEQEYDRMVARSRGVAVNSFDDRHFFPQTWRCNFDKFFPEFEFLHYSSRHPESFFKAFYDRLREHGVKESALAFIRGQVEAGRTEHSTVSSEQRRIVEQTIADSEYVRDLLTNCCFQCFS